MDAQLTPPIGTCYFKLYTVPLSQAGKFNLNVTFYVYVTNVKPTDHDFTAKGGKVYIVIVYDGSVTGSSEKTTHINGTLVDLTGDPSLFLSAQQLPIIGSGKQEGDYTFYTIDFSQTMNMYNNGGNTAFQFSARYKKDFSLYRFTQEPFQFPPESWGFNLLPFEKEERVKQPTVNNVQIFEANRLTVAKILLSFVVVDPEPRADSSEREHGFDPATTDSNNPSTRAYLTFDLDFSAETMAAAVVGGKIQAE
ncbi:hypothetical protein APHAL10511_001472 [Amanita phalloides]|nr:hypothetical protein APHAL10511_001472 [Amanita phalloides]